MKIEILVAAFVAVSVSAGTLPVSYSLGAPPTLAPGDPPDTGLAGNVIAELREMNDAGNLTTWVGTTSGVSRAVGSGFLLADWLTFTDFHGLGANNVASVETDGELCFVATALDTGYVGQGLAWSDDRGAFWTNYPQSRDSMGDTIVVYPPNDTIVAVPKYKLSQNITFDLGVADGRVWACNWGGSFRYSDDSGATWTRVILPPDWIDTLRTDGTHNRQFTLDPYDTTLTHLSQIAFSVDVLGDTVWVGTAKGILISTDRGVQWARTSRVQGLTTDFVVDLERQHTSDGRVVYWAACGQEGSSVGGLAWTDDRGTSWHSVIDGTFISNVDVQGDTVWAACTFYGTRGLHRSADFGQTWDVFTASDGLPSTDVNTVLSTSVGGVRTVWAGTNDGLAYTQDDGLTWHQVVASPGIAPDYATYAFPSPFSPEKEERGVSIRYRVRNTGAVTITVFDWTLEEVAKPVDGATRDGDTELTDYWDGRNASGDVVANGIYFYRIEGGGATLWGKVAVVD